MEGLGFRTSLVSCFTTKKLNYVMRKGDVCLDIQIQSLNTICLAPASKSVYNINTSIVHYGNISMKIFEVGIILHNTNASHPLLGVYVSVNRSQ